MIDLVVTSVVKSCSFAACILPYSFTKSCIHFLLRVFFFVQPQYYRIAKKNLEIVFPDYSTEQQTQIIKEHIAFLARLGTDSLRLPRISASWVEDHIQFPEEFKNQAPQASNDSLGALIATGHLGSFELFAHAVGLKGHRLAFVVRNFPLQKLDEWWCKTRESSGNSVIRRDGAYRGIVKQLKDGVNVGVLFDQNVTFGRAVFPKWFGLEAATTKAVAFAVVKTEAPLVVASIVYRGNGKHEVLWRRCEINQVRHDESLSRDEKVEQISQLASDMYCEIIMEAPEQWFWFHRRWKTRPDESRYEY